MVSEDGSATESASPGFNSNCGEVAEHPCVYLITTFLPSLDKGESRADLTVFPAVKDLQEAEVVVHLASKTDLAESVRSPHITYYTNILSTLNLLEMARQKGIWKFIFVSTYLYGHPQYLPIDENHPLSPHSPYNKSKFLAEQICKEYSSDYGIHVTILRPFYLYGPNPRPSSFIHSAISGAILDQSVMLSGKNIKRDFLYVDDFVNLIILILGNFPTGLNIYNVGYGKSFTLEEVLSKIGSILGGKKISLLYDKTLRPNDIEDMVADIRKISRQFSWEPCCDLDTGLQFTIDNFLSESKSAEDLWNATQVSEYRTRVDNLTDHE